MLLIFLISIRKHCSVAVVKVVLKVEVFADVVCVKGRGFDPSGGELHIEAVGITRRSNQPVR